MADSPESRGETELDSGIVTVEGSPLKVLQADEYR